MLTEVRYLEHKVQLRLHMLWKVGDYSRKSQNIETVFTCCLFVFISISFCPLSSPVLKSSDFHFSPPKIICSKVVSSAFWSLGLWVLVRSSYPIFVCFIKKILNPFKPPVPAFNVVCAEPTCSISNKWIVYYIFVSTKLRTHCSHSFRMKASKLD